MRFIVDQFRTLLIGMCALAIIAAAFLVLITIDPSNGFGVQLTGWMITVAIGSLVFLVLNLGGLAILVSLHDRHVECAEAAQDIASDLGRIATALERRVRGGEAQ